MESQVIVKLNAAEEADDGHTSDAMSERWQHRFATRNAGTRAKLTARPTRTIANERTHAIGGAREWAANVLCWPCLCD